MVSQFDKDVRRALEGDEISVITERRSELNDLKTELCVTKNVYRATCLTSAIKRLTTEINLQVINTSV